MWLRTDLVPYGSSTVQSLSLCLFLCLRTLKNAMARIWETFLSI